MLGVSGFEPIRALWPAFVVAFAVALAVVLVVLAGCAPAVNVDEGSPECTGATVSAGSDLTEESQYAEARLSFDAPLVASGSVLDDLDVRLNGKAPDGKTIAVTAEVEGGDVVVRLMPTREAAKGGSVYFALYDGQLSIAAKRDDGALPHVKAADGDSTAVLPEARVFTVPTGMQVGEAARDGNSVTFEIEQFAQLRCCAWFRLGDALPLVKMHNHAFYRDTSTTAAERLADTVNAYYGDAYTASANGAFVTVTARDAGAGALVAELVEGAGVDLSADASADPDATGEGM